MSHALATLLATVAPFVGFLCIHFLKKKFDFIGEIVNIIASIFVLFNLLTMGDYIFTKKNLPSINLFDFTNSIHIVFHVNALGYIFAVTSSILWFITTLYASFYMRSHREGNLPRFYACLALAMGFSLGVAFSGNLLTSFFFYEGLTLATVLLVGHREDVKSIRAAVFYMGILLGTSVALLLPAIVITYISAHTLSYIHGGFLEGHVSHAMGIVLLLLYVFGISKSAIMPFHGWLKKAMRAPAPVSALLHAVAVVKTGAFLIIKIGVYVFGLHFMRVLNVPTWLPYIAGFTIIAASILALTEDDLKGRLAYSTMSQLAYVTLGVAFASPAGIAGSVYQLVAHAFAKVTLFMCAGSIDVLQKKRRISRLDGLGRKIPTIFLAFVFASFSIIGFPFFGGFWVKWSLFSASIQEHNIWICILLVTSGFLAAVYLLPIPVRAFFRIDTRQDSRAKEQLTPLLASVPPLFTSLMCVGLFVGYAPIMDVISHIKLY